MAKQATQTIEDVVRRNAVGPNASLVRAISMDSLQAIVSAFPGNGLDILSQVLGMVADKEINPNTLHKENITTDYIKGLIGHVINKEHPVYDISKSRRNK